MHPESALREVDVEHGLLHFRVPHAWAARPENDGTAAFYAGDGADGVLRVKVMTFTSPDRLAPRVALAELDAMAPEPGQSLEPLPNGNALRAHREELTSGGDRTTLHVWMLAGVDPPHRMRLAVFSFAVLEGGVDELTARRTVATLDREIRHARFAHQIAA
jgi:hypothetical protein